MITPPPHNPFNGSVLTDARHDPEADVPTIHAEAFAACRRVVDQARLAQQSASLLLNGVPGSGKTHLLARLRVALEQDLKSPRSATHAASLNTLTPDPARPAAFVYVRLDSHPARLWRHLRKQLVEDLNRPVGGLSLLDRALAQHLRRCDANPDPYRVSAAAADAKLAENLAEMLDGIVHASNLARVLTQLALQRRRLDALGWLRGDSLSDAHLQGLGIQTTDSEAEEAPEDSARSIVTALIKVLQPAPVVLCFDQIEALEVEQDKHAGYAAFGRLGATLHDRANNLALISCIQTSQLDDLLDSVSVPDQGRLFKIRAEIKPLTGDQAEALVKQRLDAVPGLAELRQAQRAPLWPLDRVAVAAILARPDCTPRRLITACSELYERARGVSPVRETTENHLERSWDERVAEALGNGTGEDADGILHTSLPEALRLAQAEWRQARPPAQDIELSWQKGQRLLHISLCNHNSMQSLVARLKRLNAAVNKGLPAKDLVIIRHPQLSITRTAVRTQEELAALRDKGVQFLQPKAEAMAALSALRSLLAEAHTGDLHCNGESISAATTRSWISQRLPAELLEFVQQLLGEGIALPGSTELLLLQNLLAFLDEALLASVQEAAGALSTNEAQIIDCARRATGQVRVIEGDPVVLYRDGAGVTRRGRQSV